MLFLSTFNLFAQQTLNFDQPFGTKTWIEDGYTWSWDNSGWDNIRDYGPRTGSGHAMSAESYSAKLSTTSNIDIAGVWLKTSFSSNFSYLKLKGYDNSGNIIYTKNLNASDYEFNYAYVTLNWANVKSFAVDYAATNMMMPVDLYYDDLNYYINSLGLNNFNFGNNSKLFPNPSQDFVQISGLTKTENYGIFNILGKEVTNGSISGDEKIDIKNLTNGSYFLKFKDGKAFKFIKE